MKKIRYRAQPAATVALRLPKPNRRSMPDDLRKYFGACEAAIGFLPNVLEVYSFDATKLRAFMGMGGNSGMMVRLGNSMPKAINIPNSAPEAPTMGWFTCSLKMVSKVSSARSIWFGSSGFLLY